MSDGAPVATVPVTIRRYESSDDPAIARFNSRLADAGSPHTLYHERVGEALRGDSLPRERLFVAASATEIHGGAYLRETRVRVHGREAVVGWIKYPVSESLISRAHASVPGALVMQLGRVQPNLAAAGLGGHGGIFAQFLSRLRWQGETVPSFVLPLNPHRLAAELPQLRRSGGLRTATRALRWSGAGALGGLVVPFLARLACRAASGKVSQAEEPDSGDWVDEAWAASAPAYPLIAVRDGAWMAWQYPREVQGLIRLRLHRQGRTVGWCVMQVVDFRDSSAGPYGRVRLGVVQDSLSTPHDAPAVIAHAVRRLIAERTDLIIARHSHGAWQRALRRLGFLPGPQTFAFYRSPALLKAVGEFPPPDSMFINDGDHGIIQ